jgi:hypothetical protein
MKRGHMVVSSAAIAVALAAFAPSRADAGCFGCAVGAGVVGGLVAGTVIGSAAAAAAAPPGYYGPPPGPGCNYARRPVWDPYVGAYVPRGPWVLVCP